MARHSEIHGNIFPTSQKHVKSAKCHITLLKTIRGYDCFSFHSLGTQKVGYNVYLAGLSKLEMSLKTNS
ncbi:hypothetical protein TSUD_162370 [Trifolium subterraneum]|uniref:Uncharacterized protein n=1 Tax=Trifolium subterraneum TaxID=3900 RepID=A0A2Z6MU95_TRISU|nr:hypothetical protein TSUD_162370 [Trifolium subterraneum]